MTDVYPRKDTLIANAEALVRIIRDKRTDPERREAALEAHAKILQRLIDIYYEHIPIDLPKLPE